VEVLDISALARIAAGIISAGLLAWQVDRAREHGGRADH
jgi:hypothetical protein